MCWSSLSKTAALNDPLTGVVQNHWRTDIHMVIPNQQNTAVKITLWLGSVQHEECVRAAVALGGLRATVLRNNTDFELLRKGKDRLPYLGMKGTKIVGVLGDRALSLVPFRVTEGQDRGPLCNHILPLPRSH